MWVSEKCLVGMWSGFCAYRCFQEVDAAFELWLCLTIELEQCLPYRLIHTQAVVVSFCNTHTSLLSFRCFLIWETDLLYSFTFNLSPMVLSNSAHSLMWGNCSSSFHLLLLPLCLPPQPSGTRKRGLLEKCLWGKTAHIRMGEQGIMYSMSLESSPKCSQV